MGFNNTWPQWKIPLKTTLWLKTLETLNCPQHRAASEGKDNDTFGTGDTADKPVSFGNIVQDRANTHHFSQLYHFKGVWDARDKFAKLNVTAMQKVSTRFDNSWERYSKLKVNLIIKCVDFDDLVTEGGPDLLDQGPFTVTGRLLGYATGDEEKYKHLNNKHRHILFTNCKDIPCMKPVDDTQRSTK